jgi:metallo-beta-lactamase family protein
MQIEFLGAARTVTGSMHLVHANGARILLDCGLFQGKRAEANERNRTFPFDPAEIDAVILSHAHIDHSGNLPGLVKQGYRGPIYCTPATADLCSIMLADSAFLQEKDAEFLNKRYREEKPVEPLYTPADAARAVGQLRGVEYGKEFSVAKNAVALFSDAGHILGSAGIRLTLSRNGTASTVGFTGDIGRWNMPIIRDPQSLGDVDVLLSESTYGGILHDPPENMAEQLAADILRTIKRGGKVVVPAFSVGRTQDVIYTLHTLFDVGKLPLIPIYVDSPLAVNATEVFKRHPECFDDEIQAHLRLSHDPFGLDQIHYIRDAEESKKLNGLSIPCMIISASGMCEAGRILHHLVNTIEDPRNTILIVGYCAENTLGRRLVDQAEEVRIYGSLYRRRAEVVVHNSFSAHADGQELLKYIGMVDGKRLQKIFLVHGELERAQALAAGLGDRGYTSVEIPERGQKISL